MSFPLLPFALSVLVAAGTLEKAEAQGNADAKGSSAASHAAEPPAAPTEPRIPRKTTSAENKALARKAGGTSDILALNPIVIQRTLEFAEGSAFTSGSLQCTRKRIYLRISKPAAANVEFAFDPADEEKFTALLKTFDEWAKISHAHPGLAFRKSLGNIGGFEYMFIWNEPDGSAPFAQLSIMNRNSTADEEDVVVLDQLLQLLRPAMEELSEKENALRSVDAITK